MRIYTNTKEVKLATRTGEIIQTCYQQCHNLAKECFGMIHVCRSANLAPEKHREWRRCRKLVLESARTGASACYDWLLKVTVPQARILKLRINLIHAREACKRCDLCMNYGSRFQKGRCMVLEILSDLNGPGKPGSMHKQANDQ